MGKENVGSQNVSLHFALFIGSKNYLPTSTLLHIVGVYLSSNIGYPYLSTTRDAGHILGLYTQQPFETPHQYVVTLKESTP